MLPDARLNEMNLEMNPPNLGKTAFKEREYGRERIQKCHPLKNT
jgi:hypothetical protein